MCGINGILRLSASAPPADGGVGLASRRLAILDLSEAGAQPMASADGRFRLVMNGEIYNFLELRRQLEAEGVSFRSRGDTEVVLALYAREGAAMLSRLRGMFGLAIWDGREKTLLLARDPLGIKPLYVAAAGGDLRFASQVKALERGGAISRETD